MSTTTKGDSPATLSSRLRAGIECAPWVIEEVRKLESAAAPKPLPQWFDEPFIAEGLQGLGLQAPTPREFGTTIARRYVARIKELEEALSSAPAREQWQPIETAPKDRTEILAWIPQCGALVLYWENLSDDGRWSDGVSRFHREPTHWMPLPSAPSHGICKE